MKATGIVRKIDDLGRVVTLQRNQKNDEDKRGRPVTYNIDTFRQVLYCDTKRGE